MKTFLKKIFSLIKKEKKTNIYHNRKIKKSSNKAIAFFQAPVKEQKKAWNRIIKRANEMQREVMGL